MRPSNFKSSIRSARRPRAESKARISGSTARPSGRRGSSNFAAADSALFRNTGSSLPSCSSTSNSASGCPLSASADSATARLTRPLRTASRNTGPASRPLARASASAQPSARSRCDSLPRQAVSAETALAPMRPNARTSASCSSARWPSFFISAATASAPPIADNVSIAARRTWLLGSPPSRAATLGVAAGSPSAPSAPIAATRTGSSASRNSSTSALTARRSPISPSARATARRTSGRGSSIFEIRGTTARASASRDSARMTLVSTSTAESSRRPSSPTTASGAPERPSAVAAAERTEGSTSDRARVKGPIARALGAVDKSSIASSRSLASGSVSQPMTRSPKPGTPSARAAEAADNRTSTSGSSNARPSSLAATRSPSSAIRPAARRRPRSADLSGNSRGGVRSNMRRTARCSATASVCCLPRVAGTTANTRSIRRAPAIGVRGASCAAVSVGRRPMRAGTRRITMRASGGFRHDR